MNILFTCAGRRSYLLQYFKQALDASPHGGTILAADMSPYAPALAHADRALVVPSVYAPDYLDAVLAIVAEHAIDLVVPLNDLELPLLAESKHRFEKLGAVVLVAPPEAIAACFDKYKTLAFLEGVGLRGPKTFLDLDDAKRALEGGELDFPVVVKPRWGSASIGVEIPQTMRELELAYELVQARLDRTILAEASKVDRERAVMIQEHVGGPEYGLDVVNDLDGNHITTLVKEKIGMRSGETDRAKTVAMPLLEAAGRKIGEGLAHVGNMDCDAFIVDGEPVILEMNPRFGGGYPFSQMAGANIPAALLAWRANEEPDAEWLRVDHDVASAKNDVLVRVGGAAG